MSPFRLCPAVLLAGAVLCAGLPVRGAEPVPKNPKPKNETVQKLFADMRNRKYTGQEFPKLDWSDVPALLELADSPEIVERYPVNPLWSGVPGPAPEGLVALYLIEGVRRGGKFPTLHGVTSRGVDVNKAGERQKEIAKAYRAWWAKVKDAKPDEAQKVDPLADTKLRW